MIKPKLFFLFLGWASLTQAQQLRPEVLASAGTGSSNSANTAHLSFTMGESAIAGQSLPSFSYGQGFHNAALQPIRASEPRTDFDLAVRDFELWPNPADQMLSFRFSTLTKDEILTASVLDLLGQPVVAHFLIKDSSPKTISISHLAAGVYWLRLTDPAGKTTAIKFVKAN